jgi:hypothetical protein
MCKSSICRDVVCLSKPGDHVIIPLACDVSGNLGLRPFRDLHVVCGSLSTSTHTRVLTLHLIHITLRLGGVLMCLWCETSCLGRQCNFHGEIN